MSRRRPAWPLGLALLLVGGCARNPVTARITVDTTQRFQTVGDWEVTSQAGQSWAAYPRFRDSLMTLAADLGLSRLRLEVRSGAEHRSRDYWAENRARRLTGNAFRCARYETENDNADPRLLDTAGFHFTELDESVERLALPLKRAVEARGGRLAISVNYVAFITQCPAGWRYEHTDPEEYAEFVLAVVQHLKRRWDLTPDYWEVILEPENTADWNGTLIGRAVVATAARLREAGFGHIRFIGPSTTSTAGAAAEWDALVRVPGARQHMAELSYHRYRGVSLDALRAIARLSRRDSVRTAMLEKIGAGIDQLIGDFTIAQTSSWQQYALADMIEPKDYDGRDGGGLYFVVRRDSAPGVRLRPGVRTPGLRQVMHYVRPGGVRLAAESDREDTQALAFRNADGRHVVVARTRAERGAALSIAGLPAGSYGVTFVTQDTLRGEHPDITVGAGGVLSTTLPAAGVLTVFAR